MTPTARQRSPVRRQLEAYEESWRQDHEALQECWAWEDAVSVGMSCHALIEEVTEAWRTRVFRGTEPESDGGNDFYFSLYEVWLEVTEKILEAVAGVERDWTVVGAERLRRAASSVHETLKNWTRPRIAQAVGLREMTLTPEAAAELDRMLEESKTTPPPPLTGSKMQVMSPAEFHAMRKPS